MAKKKIIYRYVFTVRERLCSGLSEPDEDTVYSLIILMDDFDIHSAEYKAKGLAKKRYGTSSVTGVGVKLREIEETWN